MPPETHSPALPLSFRGELVPHVFRAIRGGWSCALVGVRGVGGSNLLRFLCEPRVGASHMDLPVGRGLSVYLEAPPREDPAGLFQVIARRVLAAAQVFGWPRAEQAALRNLAGRIPARGEEAGFEALLDLFGYLCADRGHRVVLAFDEFDQTFLGQPASALRALRRLRDEHKAALSYLVCTRREVTALAAQRAVAEDGVAKFAELFDQHTFPVRPYGRQDAFGLMERKTTAWLSGLSPDEQEGLYRETGGHAKSLVAALVAFEVRRHLPWPAVERGLRDNPFLAEACREIWEDLDEREQAALWLLAADRRPEVPLEDLNLLKLRGLAAGSPGVVFAGVFEAYVRRKAPPAPARAELSRPWTTRLRDPLEQVRW